MILEVARVRLPNSVMARAANSPHLLSYADTSAFSPKADSWHAAFCRCRYDLRYAAGLVELSSPLARLFAKRGV